MSAHKKRLTPLARNLRKRSTDAERKLWHHLRNRNLKGFKFRRQVPIENFIADFVCDEAKLMIELDGGQHAEQSAADTQRTSTLEQAGYVVVRYWNNQVLTETTSVLEDILCHLEKLAPHPGPLPKGERECTTQELS